MKRVAVILLVMVSVVGFSETSVADGTIGQPEDLACKAFSSTMDEALTTDTVSGAPLFDVGRILLMGLCGTKDVVRAAVLFEKGARKGDGIVGYLAAGLVHSKGLGVPRNRERARQWFHEFVVGFAPGVADEEGQQIVLRVLSLLGETAIPSELAEEIEWAKALEKAPADELYAQVQALVGERFKPTHAAAIRHWLSLALRQGHASAGYDLARYTLEGHYLEKQPLAGLHSLTQSACLDYGKAQAELARVYLAGEAVPPPSPYQAYLWLVRARNNGEDVDNLMETVEKNLTPEARQSAAYAALGSFPCDVIDAGAGRGAPTRR